MELLSVRAKQFGVRLEKELSLKKKRRTKLRGSKEVSHISAPNLASFWREMMPFFWVGLAVIICYAGTLGNDFVHDDSFEILQNPAVRDVHQWPTFFTTPAWTFLSKAGRAASSSYYRPLQYLSYGLIFHFGGANAWAFHLFKLMQHLGVCLLLTYLLKRLTGHKPIALISGLIFAVHPINTEAVSWISGITDVSCAFFLLLALIFYLRDQEHPSWLNPSLVCLFFLLGLFSKETGIMLLPLLVLIAMLWHQPLLSLVRWKRFYLPLTLCTLGYLALRVKAIGGVMYTPQFRFAQLNHWQILFNQVQLSAEYFFKFFYPYPLSASYTFEPILFMSDWRFWGSVAVLGAIGYISFFLWRTLPPDQARWTIWGGAWFFLTLAPVIILFRRIGANVFNERYLYPASLGFCLALGMILYHIYHQNRRVVIGFAAIVILLGGWQTILRNRDWKNELTLYEDMVKKSPRDVDAWTNLGITYLSLGKREEARRAYEMSLSIHPSATAYGNLALIHSMDQRYELARSEYSKAIQLESSNETFYAAAAEVDWNLRDFASARAKLSRALEIDPLNSRNWRRLAEACTFLNLHEQAIQTYEKLAALAPDMAGEAYLGMDQNYRALNQNQKANEAMQKFVATTSGKK
jgi:tetratricopeptide (TPR) repeat protein